MDSIDNIFIIAIFGCAAIATGIVIGYGIYSIFIGQRLIMRQKIVQTSLILLEL